MSLLLLLTTVLAPITGTGANTTVVTSAGTGAALVAGAGSNAISVVSTGAGGVLIAGAGANTASAVSTGAGGVLAAGTGSNTTAVQSVGSGTLGTAGVGGNTFIISSSGSARASLDGGYYKRKRSREMFAEELRRYWDAENAERQAREYARLAADIASRDAAEVAAPEIMPSPFLLDLSAIVNTPSIELTGPADIIAKKDDDLLFVMSVMLAEG